MYVFLSLYVFLFYVWCTLYNVVCFIITTNQGFFNQCVYCIRNLKYVHAKLTTNMCRKPSKDDQQSTSKAKHLCDVENLSRTREMPGRLVNFKSDPVIRFRLSIVDNRYVSIIDRLRYRQSH